MLVIVMAYGFYRAGYSIGTRYVFLQRQDVVGVCAEVRLSRMALRDGVACDKITKQLAYKLLPAIMEHIRIEKIDDDYGYYERNVLTYRGKVYIGTKELKDIELWTLPKNT